jgi:uncharacterized protein (TIGR02145 family)
VKYLLFTFAIFTVIKGNAQNYLITFKGSGAGSNISTVKVENLKTGSTLTLNSNESLNLKGSSSTTGDSDNRLFSGIKIYPNPMVDNSTIEVYPPVPGNATITVFDEAGKLVAQTQSYLENCRQDFRLSNVANGFYLINVRGSNYQYSGKLLCKGNTAGTISIKKISGNNMIQTTTGIPEIKTLRSGSDHKGTQTVDMSYTAGDRLKYTATSGKYRTVMTDIPTEDKVVEFNFISCTDGDDNNYPIVKIGNQIWMAENLKTTKYNDGTPIQQIKEDASWSNFMVGPAYCWYDNDSSYKNVYGALYNCDITFLPVHTKLCPVDWHIPNDSEWHALILELDSGSFVDMVSPESTFAGNILKEAGTAHWPAPNSGATDEVGFGALPAGKRSESGPFDGIGLRSTWWSTLSTRTINVWAGVYWSETSSNNGYSIRCIKDN